MFDLNRRKLLIGSLITGVAVSAPSLAFAEDRYQILVELQRDVIHASGVYYDVKHQMFGDTRISLANRAIVTEISGFDAKMGSLLRFLLTEFNRSDLDDVRVRQGVRDLMTGQIKIDTMEADQLRLVEDAVVSVAVVKTILSYRAPVDANRLEHFDTFATRYRSVIL